MTTMMAVYLPALLGIVGLIIAISAFSRSRNIAFLMMAAVFCFPVVAAISNRLYVSRFEQTQLGPNLWSAPVVEVNLTDPLLYGLLVVAVLFFARRGTSTNASNILDEDRAFIKTLRRIVR